MREIEYLVYNKVFDKLYTSGVCVGNGFNGLCIIDADDRTWDGGIEWIYEKDITNNLKEDDFEIYEYTNIKDKFGNKIFNGSILETTKNLGSSIPKGLKLYVLWNDIEKCYILSRNKEFTGMSDVNGYLTVSKSKGLKLVGHKNKKVEEHLMGLNDNEKLAQHYTVKDIG
jgi:hypothetical protein